LRKAQKGNIVKVNFTCTLKDGTVYDSSEGKEPLEFVIGESEVFPPLEEAVIGMAKNESKKIQIQAESVFGLYLREKAQVVDRSQFPENLTPEVGLQFHIEQGDGKKTVLSVTDVTDEKVTLTPNHPLAGEELFFTIQLLELEQSDKSKADNHFKEGIASQDKGLYDDAINSYHEAIRLNPTHAEAFYNLGVALQKKGNIDHAVVYYEIAIGLNQNLTEAHYNLGVAFKEKGKSDEAVLCFQRVIHLNPDHSGAYYNLGGMHVSEGKYEEAVQCYHKALELKPDYAEAHWNVALINLLHGQFEEGWKGYEWRWKLEGISIQRKFSRPQWEGSDISGRTILIYAEQGFGDTIQFIRYAPLITQRGARVIVECQKELASLISRVKGVDQVIVQGEPLPDFDVYCPLLSLPLVFNTNIKNIPADIPYIHTDPLLINKWRDKINSDNKKIKIGLSWSGDPAFKSDTIRSCNLEDFSPLAHLESIELYSLQIGQASDQIRNSPGGIHLVDYTDSIHDFADTAAFIANLDLVISVDTAVAHLAGALGWPVWIILPFAPDWRWMLDREDSPWYPTMKLFRQPLKSDWGSVMHRIEDFLLNFPHS
jgi:FKBP-type peptidyl-prolyl cis-trans isomerase 2